jgi:hypothetical protein
VETLMRLVPDSERSAVTAGATRARADTAEWALARLGAPGPKLCANLATTLAAIAPALPAERLALLTRYCLWTFMLDDSLDDPARTMDVVRAAADQLAGGSGPVAATLAELLPLARPYDQAGLLPRIVEAVREDVAGGVEHAVLSRRVASGETPAPTAEDYLDLAARSISYRSVSLLLLLLLDQHDSLLAYFGRVSDALTLGCRAVRLANDLRSAARHRAEGTLDVLALRTRSGDPVTPELATRWLVHHADAHDALLAHIPGCGPALIRSLRISVGMYRTGQLR